MNTGHKAPSLSSRLHESDSALQELPGHVHQELFLTEAHPLGGNMRVSSSPPSRSRMSSRPEGIFIKSETSETPALRTSTSQSRHRTSNHSSRDPSQPHVITAITPADEAQGVDYQETVSPIYNEQHDLESESKSLRDPSVVLLSQSGSVLQKGNSDPFDTYAIAIVPKVSEILTFYEKNVLPVFFGYMEANGVPVAMGKASWHDPFSSLKDEGEAYGFLARASVFMSRNAHGREYGVRTIALKNRSSELLRARLAANSMTPDQQTLRAILSMLIIAVFEEALDDAALHAKLLNFLLVKQSRRDKVDLGLLMTLIWYDFHRAAMSLTRPVCDLKGWVSDQFRTTWEQARSDLPPLSDKPTGELDVSIADEKLRVLFVAFREMNEMLSMVASDPDFTKAATRISLATYTSVCQGQLIDLYHDYLSSSTCVEADQSANDEEHNLWRAHTMAYTCLAALFWTRLAAREENVPVGSVASVFDAGAKILPQFRAALEQTEALPLGIDFRQYSRLRLWALYVGAMAEQSLTGARLDATGCWFNANFAVQAKKMQLYLWSDARKVLRAFLFSDAMKPHGSIWFSQTLSTALDG